jgi:hypothetical protein
MASMGITKKSAPSLRFDMVKKAIAAMTIKLRAGRPSELTMVLRGVVVGTGGEGSFMTLFSILSRKRGGRLKRRKPGRRCGCVRVTSGGDLVIRAI